MYAISANVEDSHGVVCSGEGGTHGGGGEMSCEGRERNGGDWWWTWFLRERVTTPVKGMRVNFDLNIGDTCDLWCAWDKVKRGI